MTNVKHVLYNQGMRRTKNTTLTVDIKTIEQIKKYEAQLRRYVPSAKVNISGELNETLGMLIEQMREALELLKKGGLKVSRRRIGEYSFLPYHFDPRSYKEEVARRLEKKD